MGARMGASLLLSSRAPRRRGWAPGRSLTHLLSPPFLRLGSPSHFRCCCLQVTHLQVEAEVPLELDLDPAASSDGEFSSIPPLPLPLLALTASAAAGDDPFPLLPPPRDSAFQELPVLSAGEQQSLAATPAHPKGLYAMYACYLFGNLVEQLWNFAWPAALSILHPSLLPVALVGFFTKVLSTTL